MKATFVYNYPCKVLFGPGMLKELHKESLPGKKAFVVIYEGQTPENSPTVKTVKDELEAAGAEVVLFDKISSNPEEPLIMEGSKLYHENGCDFIVGVGGGAILDAATLISAIAGQKDGRLWDYVQGGTGGKRRLESPPVPYIEITTTAGTGSEVDPFGVVSNPDTGEKIGFTGAYPTIAVVDPELMVTVPPLVTAYTGFDALYHSLEGLFNVNRTEYSEMIGRRAVYNVGHYLARAVNDGSDIEARTKVAFANTMSGYSMCMCGCLGIHVMANAMSGFHHNLPHGLAIAMISIAYYEYLIHKEACPDEMFVDIARLLGKEDATVPEDMITALRDLYKATGIDRIKMSDYGVVPDDFLPMVKDARAAAPHQFHRDPVYATEEELVEIYRASYR